MTERDDRICGFIDRYLAAHGYAPSIREIGAFLGVTSTSTTMTHMLNARRRGRVDWLTYQPRTFHTLKVEEGALEDAARSGRQPASP